jgi:hypothetical protein
MDNMPDGIDGSTNRTMPGSDGEITNITIGEDGWLVKEDNGAYGESTELEPGTDGDKPDTESYQEYCTTRESLEVNT